MKVDGNKRTIVIGNSVNRLGSKKNRLKNSMAGDAIKYNLRCNRNISEKMTKKDFIYDIRPPNQTFRKFEDGKYPVVLPLQLRRKQSSDSRAPQYTVILEKNDHGGGGDAMNLSEQRPLGFECNFCREQIATLLSLSTHVKFHRRTYCKYCYWILLENETMEKHVQTNHRIDPTIPTNVRPLITRPPRF